MSILMMKAQCDYLIPSTLMLLMSSYSLLEFNKSENFDFGVS